MVSLLRTVVFAVWAAIGDPLAPVTPDAPTIAEGIALAVATDELPAITGTREGDAALAAEYAYRESSNQSCPDRWVNPVDYGKSFGAFQLQGLARSLACNPVYSAAEWLRRAHASAEHCASLPIDERLAELASGSCGYGRRLVRWRAENARKLLEAVQP
jgi:hypothetical protein